MKQEEQADIPGPSPSSFYPHPIPTPAKATKLWLKLGNAVPSTAMWRQPGMTAQEPYRYHPMYNFSPQHNDQIRSLINAC